jgi:hypothetical protein
MKVVRRILIKFVLLLLVIALGGGCAAAYRGYQQSTPEYAINRYLTLLTDNNSEKAYTLLDQSDDVRLTKSEFTEAVSGKKYSLYSAFTAEASVKTRDNDGNEYAQYHVTFVNAANEVQAEEDITLKKQSEQRFGLFDEWKVLGTHCMVQNFRITVPTGATVYLDGEEADTSWMTRESNSPITVCTIPQILPGEVALTIRHPILESVNTTIDVTGDDVDYSTKMGLKKAAQDECKETGVAVLKNLLMAAAKQDKKEIDDSLSDCKKAAESFVSKESELLYVEDREFKSIAVSAFATQFSEPVLSEENGSIQTEMTFSYHYRIKWEITSLSEELYQEDGTPMEIVDTVDSSGNSTAKLTMEYKDGAWSVVSLEIPETKKDVSIGSTDE